MSNFSAKVANLDATILTVDPALTVVGGSSNGWFGLVWFTNEIQAVLTFILPCIVAAP